MRIMAADLKSPAEPERIPPVGLRDFPEVRENGYICVDKAADIYKRLAGSVARPPRFGKPLLYSTLGAVFEGRRELFGETAGRPAGEPFRRRRVND